MSSDFNAITSAEKQGVGKIAKLGSPIERDIPALQHIWSTVFGNNDVEVFFANLFDPELSSAAFVEGVPVSAAYLIPAGKIARDDGAIPCAMVYGVATLPEHRGRGFGTATVGYLLERFGKTRFPAIALCPSDDGLFSFYGDRTAFREFFYVCERVFISPAPVSGVELIPVSSENYGDLREDLLSSTPHIAHDGPTLRYQEELCRLFGGGLYEIISPTFYGCVVIERQQDGAVILKELLPSPGAPDEFIEAVVCAVAAVFPSSMYTARFPADGARCGGTAARRFGMMATGAVDAAQVAKRNSLPWLGLAFD